MKQKHFINSHKGATAPAVFLLIWYFGQWENTTALIYLALHGSYGIMWVLKSAIFPDKTWEADAHKINLLRIKNHRNPCSTYTQLAG